MGLGDSSTDSLATCPILVIDDKPENLQVLRRMLEWAGFPNVVAYASARKALECLDTVRPDLIMVDLMMPEMDGFEFLRRFREMSESASFLPVLIFTADISPASRIKALDLGASDFLTKPGDAVEIKLKVRNFLQMRRMHTELAQRNQDLETLVKERTDHLLAARRETIEVLASACEYRDDITGHHAQRVGVLSFRIANALRLPERFCQSMRLAATLHDLGKIALPDAILFKPSGLTELEYERVKLHPKLGADLLGGKRSPLLQLAREIALYHHERWDGAGYGFGLAGARIPISARIVAVADSFDAMTSDRPYRKGLSTEAAFDELRRGAGSQFDPDVVQAMLDIDANVEMVPA